MGKFLTDLMPLQSQTWTNLSKLLRELPKQRSTLLALCFGVFGARPDGCVFSGFIGPSCGLLSGARLADYLPGIKVFGGGLWDQSGWLVALLIAFSGYLPGFVLLLP